MTPGEARAATSRLYREVLVRLNAMTPDELAAHADEIVELFADFARVERKIEEMENR